MNSAQPDVVFGDHREASGSTAERGGAPSVEAALLAVAFGLVIALSIAGGRLVFAESTIDHAARAAARIASLQREPARAQELAESAAQQVLSDEGLACRQLTVSVDVSQLSRSLGATATAIATVACTLQWSDLGLPGASTRDLTAEFSSSIDRLRERP
jgi:Flp pilus assembly protein TadG